MNRAFEICMNRIDNSITIPFLFCQQMEKIPGLLRRKLQKLTFFKIAIYFFILFSMGFSFSVFTQDRSDFFDNYDYSLRNYNGGESISSSEFQDYKLPRPRKKPSLIDSKNIRVQPDPSLFAPQASGTRRAATSNTQQQGDVSNLPINPITGEINTAAILKNQETSKQRKELSKKLRDEKSKEIYSESSLRRAEIIFFSTLPFAIGGSAALGLVINHFNAGFFKSNAGAAFVAVGAIGFSFTNVYLDQRDVRNHEREKSLGFSNAPQPIGVFSYPIEINIPFWEVRF
jgi:hypothetical protein